MSACKALIARPGSYEGLMSAHEHFCGSPASDKLYLFMVRAQVESSDGRLWAIARSRSGLLPLTAGITLRQLDSTHSSRTPWALR